MSGPEYFFGLAQLLVVLGAIGYTAVRLRRHLLPGWDEAAGYLVTAVTGIGLLVVLSELLGVVGLLHGAGLWSGRACCLRSLLTCASAPVGS